MRSLRIVAVAVVLGLVLGLVIGVALAQTATAPQPQVTCEQQLEQAQTALIQLRKEKAQAEWSAASLEEFGRSCKKQLDAATAPAKPDKAAAQGPPTVPAPSQPPAKK